MIGSSCLDAGDGPAKRVDERRTLLIAGPARYAEIVSGEPFTDRWCEAPSEGRR